MKYIKYVLILGLLLIPAGVSAEGSCCTDHGGVDYCVTEGYWVCKDGTESKSCSCSGSYYLNKKAQPTTTAVVEQTNPNNTRNRTTYYIIISIAALVLGLAISFIKANLVYDKKDDK